MVFFDETRPHKVKASESDDAEFEKTAELFGDEDAAHQQLVRAHLAGQRLGREWPELLKQYPDQWIAMDADGVAAVADTHEALLEALAAKGIYAGNVITDLMETDPEVLIL